MRAALHETLDHEAVPFGAHVDKQHKPLATPLRFRRLKVVSAARAMTSGVSKADAVPTPARTSVPARRFIGSMWLWQAAPILGRDWRTFFVSRLGTDASLNNAASGSHPKTL